MNWYIISGIICAAIGTALLTYGGIFRSRSESGRSEKQLEQISRDLADLRGKPKSDLSKDAISRVENDIEKWAREFASDKQRRRLLAEQKRSQHDSSLEHSNALAREYFEYFLAVIRDALASYAASSGEPLSAELPDISDTLFSDQNPYYEGRVRFNARTSWGITTSIDSRSPSFAPPWIVIRLLQEQASGGPKEKGELSLRFTIDGKSFWLRLQQDFTLAVPVESVTKSTTEYEETIRSTLIGLIEFQLLED